MAGTSMGGNPFSKMQDMKMDQSLGIKEGGAGNLQKALGTIRSVKKPGKKNPRIGQYNFGNPAPISRASIKPLPLGMGNPGFGGSNH